MSYLQDNNHEISIHDFLKFMEDESIEVDTSNHAIIKHIENFDSFGFCHNGVYYTEFNGGRYLWYKQLDRLAAILNIDEHREIFRNPFFYSGYLECLHRLSYNEDDIRDISNNLISHTLTNDDDRKYWELFKETNEIFGQKLSKFIQENASLDNG